MAAPNIVNVSTITGITTIISGVNTTPINQNGKTGTGNECGITTIVSNATGSGKVLKINTLQVTAIGDTTGVDVKYFDAAAGLGNSVGLGITMTVPLYSALTVIDKSNPIYIEENRSLGAHRQVYAGTLQIVCSYEEIS
jgi:hypothetical protein